MFKKPFSFKGRITRKEFAYTFYIFNVLLLASVGLANYTRFYTLCIIPFDIWFYTAQRRKRIHDVGDNLKKNINRFEERDKALMRIEGDIGANQYGDDPREGN